MSFCPNCGTENEAGSNFCRQCGIKLVANAETAKTDSAKKVDGKIHKCPNCGESLQSFTHVCPSCGYELRDTIVSETLKKFTEEYNKASSTKREIDLLQTYLIPNTKEDITEFVILATENIKICINEVEDPNKSVDLNDDDSYELLGAWFAKLEQAYNKAKIVLVKEACFSEIEKHYFEQKQIVAKVQKNKKISGFFYKNKKIVIIVSAAIVAAIALFISITVLTSGYNTKEKELEQIVAQIEGDIINGDYYSALNKANSLDYDNLVGGRRKKWKEIKDSYINQVQFFLGKIKVPDLSDYKKKNYSDIVTVLQDAGFSFIVVNKITNFISHEYLHEKVKEITIDGTSIDSINYLSGEYIHVNSKIVINYYDYSNKAQIPTENFIDHNHSEVAEKFRKAGFSNVVEENLSDMLFGIFYTDGAVKEIYVGGDTNYDPGRYVDSNTKIVIKYHGY